MSSKQDILAALRAQVNALETSSCLDFYDGFDRENPFDGEGRDAGEDSDISSSPSINAPVTQESVSDGEYPKKNALSKIYDLINASEKSEATIRDRLMRAKYVERDIDDAVDRAKQCGLIDDDRYARVLIQSRITQGWGSKGIERELLRNNIDPEGLTGWPYEYPFSDDEQLERAMRFLERHPPRSKNTRESAYRKLIQKGYASSIASQVARLWAERMR